MNNEAKIPALIEIRHRRDDAALFAAEAADMRAAVIAAHLAGAHLTGAHLARANLSGAHLARADLSRARINWSSHALVAELLRRGAGDDVDRRKIAGLVLVSRDWCWDEFQDRLTPGEWEWSLSTLAPLVTDGDDAPAALLNRRAKIEAVAAPEKIPAS